MDAVGMDQMDVVAAVGPPGFVVAGGRQTSVCWDPRQHML
jgi:hypothetical protein